MTENISRLQQMIDDSKNIVFFGGAGVSTASGIPDFRSSSGIYSRTYEYPPEVMISNTFFRRHPALFFDFYKNNMIFPEAEPNAAHTKLAHLEENGKLKAIVTQNIDGLHQKAGSHTVLELHGSVLRNFCVKCHAFYDVNHVLAAKDVPVCSLCGGIVKPDVVLYEEQLKQSTMESTVSALAAADMLIVGGTSLTVYPAAGFVDAFTGRYLVIINQSTTPKDKTADLLVNQDIAEVFSQLNV